MAVSTKLLIVVENLNNMIISMEEKLEKDKKPPPNLDHMLETLEKRLDKDGVPITYKGICSKCEEAIHGMVCSALGRTYHPEHFSCTVCEKNLFTETFYEREGKAFCETDYHDKYAPKCFHCKEPVIGPCVTLENQTWHPEHFVCDECKQGFTEDGFYAMNGKAYCFEDYKRLFAPVCPSCGEYVLDVVVNKKWHQECLKCADCNTPLEGKNFYEDEKKPYCETHYRAKRKSVCHSCKKLILRQCITAMGLKFHPEHFTCNYCQQPLNQGTFKESSGKPFCKRCHLKVFGFY